MYSATVGAALTVHQYGKTCRKYSPCSTVLEHCTLFKQCKFTVFSPVILSKEDTLRVAPRRYVCAGMLCSMALLSKDAEEMGKAGLVVLVLLVMAIFIQCWEQAIALSQFHSHLHCLTHCCCPRLGHVYVSVIAYSSYSDTATAVCCKSARQVQSPPPQQKVATHDCAETQQKRELCFVAFLRAFLDFVDSSVSLNSSPSPYYGSFSTPIH